jgi:hypothetical protein
MVSHHDHSDTTRHRSCSHGRCWGVARTSCVFYAPSCGTYPSSTETSVCSAIPRRDRPPRPRAPARQATRLRRRSPGLPAAASAATHFRWSAPEDRIGGYPWGAPGVDVVVQALRCRRHRSKLANIGQCIPRPGVAPRTRSHATTTPPPQPFSPRSGDKGACSRLGPQSPPSRAQLTAGGMPCDGPFSASRAPLPMRRERGWGEGCRGVVTILRLVRCPTGEGDWGVSAYRQITEFWTQPRPGPPAPGCGHVIAVTRH